MRKPLSKPSQGINDSELLLLCSFLFGSDEEAKDGATAATVAGAGMAATTPARVAPLLDHLNLGSNRIGDRGLHGLLAAATRAPRPRLSWLSLSGNAITDAGATALAAAIMDSRAFPGLQMLSVGGNAHISSAGEAALRSACAACGVSVRGVGSLRGAPLVKRPLQGSWVVRVVVESEDATRAAVPSQVAQHVRPAQQHQEQQSSAEDEQQQEQRLAAFARGVRERAVARRDPLISPAPQQLVPLQSLPVPPQQLYLAPQPRERQREHERGADG